MTDKQTDEKRLGLPEHPKNRGIHPQYDCDLWSEGYEEWGAAWRDKALEFERVRDQAIRQIGETARRMVELEKERNELRAKNDQAHNTLSHYMRTLTDALTKSERKCDALRAKVVELEKDRDELRVRVAELERGQSQTLRYIEHLIAVEDSRPITAEEHTLEILIAIKSKLKNTPQRLTISRVSLENINSP